MTQRDRDTIAALRAIQEIAAAAMEALACIESKAMLALRAYESGAHVQRESATCDAPQGLESCGRASRTRRAAR